MAYIREFTVAIQYNSVHRYGRPLNNKIHFHKYYHLSSTWCEFDPNTAYVVCISICPYFLIWYPYAPTSLYGNTAHCSGYGVAMGCYRLCIVPRTAIVTSQWYDRYCFTEYARTWARRSWLVSEGLRYTRFSMSGGTSWKKKRYETLKMADKTSIGRRNCVFSSTVSHLRP